MLIFSFYAIILQLINVSGCNLNKKQKLLNEMIAVYVRDGEPIGSESLKLMTNIKISSSTIRNYFKILVREGVLYQPHVSSGRIPTNDTLRIYWRDNINVSDLLLISNLKNIKMASNKHNIFCNIRLLDEQILKDIINFNDRYILLIFSSSEAIIPYSRHLFSFMNDLVNKNIEEIKDTAKNVGLSTLFYKLEALSSKAFNFGFQFLSDIKSHSLIEEIINGLIYYRLKNGFYFNLFPDGYLALIQDIKINSNYGKMFIFGKLFCNYKDFYEEIAS